jgi:hypothetical protein
VCLKQRLRRAPGRDVFHGFLPLFANPDNRPRRNPSMALARRVRSYVFARRLS